MNQTIALPALIAELAKTNNCHESTATDFIHGLARVITQGLATDGEVTIKGLGTLRLTDTPDGSEVAFRPCPELAQEVNAPFALFEPVELSDGITEADLDTDAATTTAPAENTTPPATPQAPAPAHQTNEEQTTENQKNEEPTSPARPPHVGSQTPPQPQQTEHSKPNTPADTTTPADTPAAGGTPVDIPPVPQRPTTAPGRTINEVYSQTTRTYTESDPPRLREERIVKVVDRRPNKAAVALAAVIALVAGLVGGYTAYEWLNFKGPKNVEIKAEQVNVNPSVDIVLQADSTAAEAAVSNSTATVSNSSDSIGRPDATHTAATAAGQPSAAETPKVVTDTVEGRRYLSVIARRHYGNDIFWVYIYEENKAKIANPNNVPEGLVVVIPPADKYGIDPNDKESIRAAEIKAARILQNHD